MVVQMESDLLAQIQELEDGQ